MPFIYLDYQEVVICRKYKCDQAPFQSGLTATFNIQVQTTNKTSVLSWMCNANKLLKKIPLSNLSLTGLLIVSYKICILKISVSSDRNTMVLFLILPN